MVTVAALFVDPKGCYANLPDVDLWPEARDARNYQGPYPVIAHPPCNRWSQMNYVNAARWGYKMGEDDGCFLSALHSVRQWGGVLEHPAGSLAFKTYAIQKPLRGSWQKVGRLHEWVCEVNQAAYGHMATKRTWLFYCGLKPPPELIWKNIRGTHQIGGFDVTLPQLPIKLRSATPIPFRDLLISIAEGCK